MARPRNPDNIYWTSDMNQHITIYNALTDEVQRNDYFVQNLYKPMKKLCECVCNKFKFPYIDLCSEDMQADVLGYIVGKLPLYNCEKGNSFGYFTVAAKNYLVGKNNTAYTQQCRTLSWEKECSEDVISSEITQAMTVEAYDLSPYCDPHFLEQLVAYWKRTQLSGTNHFFTKKYNVVLQEILDSITQHNESTFVGGQRVYNKMIMDKIQTDSDSHYSRSVNVIRRIRKVCRLALKHYCKYGDLERFTVLPTKARDNPRVVA